MFSYSDIYSAIYKTFIIKHILPRRILKLLLVNFGFSQEFIIWSPSSLLLYDTKSIVHLSMSRRINVNQFMVWRKLCCVYNMEALQRGGGDVNFMLFKSYDQKHWTRYVFNCCWQHFEQVTIYLSASRFYFITFFRVWVKQS